MDLLLFVGAHLSSSFAPLRSTSASRNNNQRISPLHALTPVGPFCPFRSEASEAFEPNMENLSARTGSDFATEMARVQLDMQMGQTPDPDRLRSVADGIDAAVEQWRGLITRLSVSPDFQTKEYAKLTQAQLATHGMTIAGIASMMTWQAECMRSMADNTPPPMPPTDVDLSKLVEMSQGGNDNKPPPSITSMAAAEAITANPFTGKEEAFSEPTVKEEYEKLCRDHNSLIAFGSKYDTFDPLGKLRYLDEIEKIEERWNVFYARFKLMGVLNQDFVEQCNAFLAGMGLDEQGYQELLRKCHSMMRSDAEAERTRLGL